MFLFSVTCGAIVSGKGLNLREDKSESESLREVFGGSGKFTEVKAVCGSWPAVASGREYSLGVAAAPVRPVV